MVFVAAVACFLLVALVLGVVMPGCRRDVAAAKAHTSAPQFVGRWQVIQYEDQVYPSDDVIIFDLRDDGTGSVSYDVPDRVLQELKRTDPAVAAKATLPLTWKPASETNPDEFQFAIDSSSLPPGKTPMPMLAGISKEDMWTQILPMQGRSDQITFDVGVTPRARFILKKL